MLRVLLQGSWRAGDVTIVPAPSSHAPTPDTHRLIDSAWRLAKQRLGDRLFDGPMCRFEGFDQPTADTLRLRVSRTSYRVFLGTNMAHPELPDAHRANPIGVSTLLVTSDGFAMLGRRNDSVAYYPRMLHPFAGSLEPAESIELFTEARRELREELSLTDAQLRDLRLLGIVEDLRLRHPETILVAYCTFTRDEIESRLDAAEHTDCWACQATAR
jgi:8-oxo-dGTP pyrophosphatase MutT (NUDIX family)